MTQTILLLLVTQLVAQAEVDTSEWLCESCPFENGYRADYDVGVTYVSDEDARSGNATGYDTDGLYLNVDGDGAYTNDGYRLTWQIEDLGLASRAVRIDAGRQGQFDSHIGYTEVPYRRFDSTQTIFNASADGLQLPSDWIAAGTTAGFTALDTSLKAQNIGSDRQTAELGANWLMSESLQLFADYQRQTRDGIDIKSGGGFTHASLLPRRIDFATDQIDLGIRYLNKSGSLTLAYYGSYFSNRNLALTWQSPFTTAAGAERLTMAEEPDNSFQQFSLAGVYHTGWWNSVVAFSAASGQSEQDDSLLSYTTNPNINSSSLPVSSLNGKVDTGNYAFSLTAHPFARARVRVSYRYDERDNTTAVNNWSRVITDVFPSGETEQNVPHSFERARLSAVANIRVLDNVRVAAGFERTDLDRDFQEVAEQTEDDGWGQLRWRPANWLDLRARGGRSRRDIERYDETVAISLGQNPLLRKYNLAYRYREYAEVSASISPASAPVSLSATLYTADDNYTESQLGITSSDEQRYAADLSWAITDGASTWLTYGNESIDAEQLGSAQGGAADWQATHDDSFDHWGLGFHWRQPDGKFDVRLDFSAGDGDTRIVVSDAGVDNALPRLSSELASLRAEVAYRWSDKLDVTVEARYESFSTEDWALADVAPDTLATVLTLGATPYDYDIWALGIGVRYYLGGRDLQLTN